MEKIIVKDVLIVSNGIGTKILKKQQIIIIFDIYIGKHFLIWKQNEKLLSYRRGGIALVENKDWKCLRKGNRVRKYKNRYDHTTDYIDGTVVKGINCSSDGFVYVQWDGQKMIDMSVNSYDLVKLQ